MLSQFPVFQQMQGQDAAQQPPPQQPTVAHVAMLEVLAALPAACNDKMCSVHPNRRLAVSEALAMSSSIQPWIQAAFLGVEQSQPQAQQLYLNLGLQLVHGWCELGNLPIVLPQQVNIVQHVCVAALRAETAAAAAEAMVSMLTTTKDVAVQGSDELLLLVQTWQDAIAAVPLDGPAAAQAGHDVLQAVCSVLCAAAGALLPFSLGQDANLLKSHFMRIAEQLLRQLTSDEDDVSRCQKAPTPLRLFGLGRALGTRAVRPLTCSWARAGRTREPERRREICAVGVCFPAAGGVDGARVLAGHVHHDAAGALHLVAPVRHQQPHLAAAALDRRAGAARAAGRHQPPRRHRRHPGPARGSAHGERAAAAPPAASSCLGKLAHRHPRATLRAACPLRAHRCGGSLAARCARSPAWWAWPACPSTWPRWCRARGRRCARGGAARRAPPRPAPRAPPGPRSSARCGPPTWCWGRRARASARRRPTQPPCRSWSRSPPPASCG